MSTGSIDLNADLGEGGPADHDLLQVVTSASVACGFHAGDPQTMVATARRAGAGGVVVGAHPSYPDRDGFGRRSMELDPEHLLAAVAYQVGAMVAAAATVGTRVGFVKLHGALYNRAAVDPATAEAVAEAVRVVGAAAGRVLPLLCPPESELAARAGAAGLTVYVEAFADRAYRPDGRLADRSAPGAVITDPEAVAARAVELVRHRRVTAVDGTVIGIEADSICVHGDTPGALQLARAVRRALEDSGVAVRPFAGP